MCAARTAAKPGALKTAGVPAAGAWLDPVSEQRLATVVPALARRVRQVMQALATLGHPVRVTAGRRTTEGQQTLYAQGRTAPGAIVTYADGVRRRSTHQDGRAVDVVWRTPDGGVSWTGPWELYGLACEAVGLAWGGRWRRPVDRPHCEWAGPEED